MSAAMSAAEAEEAACAPVEVNQICLGIRYLRLLDAHHHGTPASCLVPLLCRSCDRTLSYTDQLLCTNRRWGFGRAPPEPACFVNSLVRHNVNVRGTYEEQLAQGLMLMADVYCKCGVQVGYSFEGDRTSNRRNLNQVGRKGLVCSRFYVAPYQISKVDLPGM